MLPHIKRLRRLRITVLALLVAGGPVFPVSARADDGFSNDINWERLADITGLSTHVIIVNRSGANTSHSFADNL